jgi:hypothetical protein
MKYRSLPSQAFLLECFDHDPETGTLTWRIRPRDHFIQEETWKKWNSRHAGNIAGSKSNREGWKINILGDFLAHRIIWKMVTGEDPPEIIDHKNFNALDNSWDNLRLATHSQNKQNLRAHKDNSTGLKGVSFDKSRWLYVAQLQVNGVPIRLGRFANKYDAHKAYCEAALNYFGEFFRST